MLPILVFILWAYGSYALISALSGRRGNRNRARRPLRRYTRLGLVATIGVGLSLAVVLAQSFSLENQNLKLAGFLGTVWAEDWPDRVERRAEDPPIKSSAYGEQPVYTLLHPGTPPTELAKEKPAPKPKAAPKIRNPQGKRTNVATQNPKKDQITLKNKAKAVKKKKAPSNN